MLHAKTSAVAVALAVFGLGVADATAEVSFKGKTITMIVGSDPGGGTDASGRVIAPFLHKYLPGEPNIIVQNMPGASGITSLNYFVKRTQPDGLTMMMGSISTIDPVVFRNSSAQYDPKTFEVVGGIGRGGSIIFVTSEAQKRLFDKAALPVVIGTIMGMPRPAMQPALWCIEYLGWNAKWVAGYHGTNEVMLAFDRGEIDMTSTGNIFQIADRLKSGHLRIVNQTGSIEHGKVAGRVDFGDAPLFPDEMKGKITDPIALKAFDYWTALNTGDKYLALAPDTPADIVQAYRDAFQKASADKEMLELGERISDGFTPQEAHDVAGVMRTLADTPQEAVDYTKALMRKQGLRIQ